MPATTTQAGALLDKLHGLGVDCTLLGVRESPQLVRYELAPGLHTRMRDFSKLGGASDIAYALGARTVRIEAPIPGRAAVGIEVDRHDTLTIPLADLPLAAEPLNIPLGVDVEGEIVTLPLTDAPHAIVAGQTGSGKSILLHVIAQQILRSYSPAQAQLVLIDPKRVEFAPYAGSPHLAMPLADDTTEAVAQLEGLAAEMDRRYETMEQIGARDVSEINWPYIVVIADEIAELVMTTPDAERLLVRIAQKGRAAGLHLVLATQYPKAEVITGLLRVNVPTKIALRVPDKIASRVIMGSNGAETLLGKGDALMSLGGLPPVRFQTALVSDFPTFDAPDPQPQDKAAETGAQSISGPPQRKPHPWRRTLALLLGLLLLLEIAYPHLALNLSHLL